MQDEKVGRMLGGANISETNLKCFHIIFIVCLRNYCSTHIFLSYSVEEYAHHSAFYSLQIMVLFHLLRSSKAQWMERWPADLAAPDSIPAGGNLANRRKIPLPISSCCD